MPDRSIILHARAHLRVAWSDGDASPHAYEVVDSAGSVLSRETSLDDAKARIDQLLRANTRIADGAKPGIAAARTWRGPAR